MAERMALTLAKKRLFVQHARPKDAALPFAENAAVAVDMLRSGHFRVQMNHDVAEGRKVREMLRRQGRVIS